MIKQLDIDAEKNQVLAFRVEGKISENDVKKSVDPIKINLESPSHFNLYLEVKDIEKITPDALKERFEFVFPNYKKIINKVDKVALVTDVGWLHTLVEGIYTIVPSIEQQSFSFNESDKAIQWISE